MAQVFRATDLAGGKPIALKLLKPEIAFDGEAIARLRREGEILSKLDTPAIVGIETFGRLDDGRIFIAMEMLEGETLGERMRREGQMDPRELTPIVTGLVAGLAAAHRADIIHRDLKPDNVFLTRAPTRQSVPTRMGTLSSGGASPPRPDEVQVKLVDFGISKAFDFARLTRTGQILGTPRYMAPEQLAADDDIDARVDVYALGVMLYEALAGSPPFVAASPSDLIVAILHGKVTPLSAYRSDLSHDVVAVVSRAMARSRDARYATATDLAEAWLAVAHAPTPSLPREGMRTNVLGGLAVTPTRESAEPEPGLRLGTFSEIEQRRRAVEAASSARSATTSNGSGATSPERPRVRTPDVAAEPAPAAIPEKREVTAPPSQGVWSANDSYGGDSEPLPTLPTNGRRTGLIIGAVLAGAISAGAVIFALQYLSAEEPPPPPTPTEAPRTSEVAPPQEPAPPAAEEAVLPVGAEPPDPSPERRAPPRTQTARSTPVEEADESPDDRPPTTSEVLVAARTLLRAGDSRGCLDTLAPLGDRLPASALRLEADCHLRGGDRDAALKSYERYCATFENGPDIAEVRTLVATYGGRCP